MPHIPNPDPELLKALADAGLDVSPEQQRAAKQTTKPARPRARRRRAARVRVPPEPAKDDTWIFLFWVAMFFILAGLMS